MDWQMDIHVCKYMFIYILYIIMQKGCFSFIAIIRMQQYFPNEWYIFFLYLNAALRFHDLAWHTLTRVLIAYFFLVINFSFTLLSIIICSDSIHLLLHRFVIYIFFLLSFIAFFKLYIFFPQLHSLFSSGNRRYFFMFLSVQAAFYICRLLSLC